MSTNDRWRKLQIRSRDGSTADTEVLLDGEPLRGVVRVEFVADGRAHGADLITVRVEMYASEVEIDADVMERVFVAPGEDEGRKPEAA